MQIVNEILEDMFGTAYSTDNIFQEYQNDNYTPPQDDFISFFFLDAKAQGYPQNYFNNVQQKMIYNNLDSTGVQINFYGKKSMQDANQFRYFINSAYAADMWNSEGYSVHKVGELVNACENNILDRQKYVKRFIVRFYIFNNTYFNADVSSTKTADVNLVYVETL